MNDLIYNHILLVCPCDQSFTEAKDTCIRLFSLLQVESAWTICKLSSTLSWLEVSMDHKSVMDLRISSGNLLVMCQKTSYIVDLGLVG